MGLRDIWPYQSTHGGSYTILQAPMTAAEAFLPGELVSVVAAGTVTAVHQDGAQFVLANTIAPHMAGVALNGPGLATATAEKPASQGYGRLFIHPDSGDTYANSSFAGGATGSPLIWFVPFDDTSTFITRNVLAAGGAAGAGAAFTGADRGDIFQLTYGSSTTPDIGWSIERTTGVQNTDYAAQIVDVLDANGRSVSIAGTGTFAVFRVLV